MKRLKKYGLYSLIPLCILLWLLMNYAVAVFSVHPNPQEIPSKDRIVGYPVQEISFWSEDSLQIAAWWAEGERSDTAVVMLAGIWRNRLMCEARAKFYLDAGYSVLLPDLRGTGESEGDYVSFGWHERKDLLAACDWLENEGIKEIGVHAISLGAATTTYSFVEKNDYAFVFLESCYDNIDHAFDNRSFLITSQSLFVRPMRHWVEKWTNTQSDDLYPENYIALYEGVLWMIAGDAELRVKKEETEKLYQRSQAQHKRLIWMEDGKHKDFLTTHTQTFTESIHLFLKFIKQQSHETKHYN